jgi:hypothetical protein
VVPLEGVQERGASADHWQTLVADDDVVLKVREGIAPGKLKQLGHIAALIRALDEDE